MRRLAAFLLTVLLLATGGSAAAQTVTVGVRYWGGAQLGVWRAVGLTGSVEIRYQSFAGTYVADSPTYYATEAQRVTIGTGSIYAGWDRVSWGPPFGASFSSPMIGARSLPTSSFSWEIAWLPVGWDASAGVRFGDLEVGYATQRRIGPGCADPYCENSGPYLGIAARF